MKAEWNEASWSFVNELYPISKDITWNTTNDPYQKIVNYSSLKSAENKIENLKATILENITSGYVYVNCQESWQFKQLKNPPIVTSTMIKEAKVKALLLLEDIFSRMKAVKVDISGFNIIFTPTYENVKVHIKKKNSYDSCSVCGLSFDNKMPYIRGSGSRTCLCKMCLRNILSEMELVELPEGYEQDYKRKALLFNLK